ncbi:23S rRNA (guanosine(2251)-2'-O)-methyltransferase RlmB [Euzebya tangerina]|uniref:23S rRNA (guanosine(2251)-2'-O)-methyltransferase RlmB n=1 Tax=Euzebya tangerina TaxID=591198 RepID=UPI0013C2B564|nr:23S rRNA (guanosine(2251)-2'-O)-methyltransferase RlmB [Euzebya tangerina]
MSRGGRSDVIPGRGPVREALAAGRELREIVVDRKVADATSDIAEQARAADIPVRQATRHEMDTLTGEVRHQGVLALAAPFAYAPLDQATDGDLVIVLDGVTDPRNLGAIARVAELAGAAALVIRDRRAAAPSPAAEKASAGALSWLPIIKVTNITRALESLSDAGLWTVGLEGGATTSIWDQPLLDERIALVIGEEGQGLSRLVAERVDARVTIPMAGHLDSLNASTAAAVATFEWCRRRVQTEV